MVRGWKSLVLAITVLGLCLVGWGAPVPGHADCSSVNGRTFLRIFDSNGFLVNTEQGVSIFSMAVPGQPEHLGSIALQKGIQDLDFHEDGYAYLVDDKKQLQIVCISNPKQCAPVGRFMPYAGLIDSVSIQGDYAFIAVSGQGWKVLDISSPVTPREIATVDSPAQVKALQIKDGHAYITNFNGGLHVFDVMNPRSPREVAVLDIPGRPRTVGVSDDALYMTTADKKIYLINVADPASPAVVGAFSTGNSPVAAVYGTKVIAADLQKGLVISDVSDPANHTELAKMNLDGAALGICVRGHHAYLSMADTNEIKVVDLRLVGGMYHAER